MDMGDMDIALYLVNMMNIINTLKILTLNFYYCGKQYLDNPSKDPYEDVVAKKEYWLNGNFEWSFPSGLEK